MAKLKSLSYSFKSEVGDELKFKSDVSVNSEGIFSLTIPDELVFIIDKLLRNLENKGMQRAFTRSHKNIICGHKLDSCERLMGEAGKDYMACEIKSENVILYSASNTISYFKSPEGKILPNGTFSEAGYGKGGKWCGTLNSSSRSNFYSIGFMSVCREKITYIRSSGTKVEYKHSNNVQGEYWKLLNSFCGVTVEEEKMNELPYTEETAKFFYNTMLGMCHLADKIESFFNDEKALNKAIKGNTPLLLDKTQ